LVDGIDVKTSVVFHEDAVAAAAEQLENERLANPDRYATDPDWNARARNVFLTLNKLRRERATSDADLTALNAALDRLARDVFYNPNAAILEPHYLAARGDTLETIAAQLGVTPETLGAINGLNFAPAAQLPADSVLKTIRGPVAAEISIGKKELLLTFNGLYAGRFKLGVPESMLALRGKFTVSAKYVNPPCDAVGADGARIPIAGGAPENPLGAAWINLVDAANSRTTGLQGTNRPELVGSVVPENGGFIFSNREVSQLNVLLPDGAIVEFVD
ncbi:MAG: LysM peptidoglycan-binding domain-containing protein, partial [Thermoguttaceae bacterium]|nr:LysM peptidoglycan-binding domain-containing protein [Thermoguttaceae bacterium]